MTAPFHTPALRPVQVDITDEPVLNVLVSMAHLGKLIQSTTERPAELDTWLIQASKLLSDEDLRFHRLLFGVLGAVLLPAQSHTDFAAYLDQLAAANPEQLRDRALGQSSMLTTFPETSEHYQAHIQQLYPHEHFETAILEEAYALIQHPAELQCRVVAHLHQLWEPLFAQEWRKRSMLMQALIVGLRSRDIPQSSAPDVLQAVIGRDVSAATLALLWQVEKLVIVPSPHVSLYVSRFNSPDTAWVFVGFSTIMSWTLRQEPIKISEVMMRLNPLADETRLRVLELLAQQGELSAQELIRLLDTSQSTVSRHLKALGKYVIERRADGAAKYYRLNPGFLEWTVVTLRRFMASAGEQTVLVDLSENARGFVPAGIAPGPSIQPDQRKQADLGELGRFMNHAGRIHSYPTRRRDQLMMLEHLWKQFESGHSYTEREVNEIIRAQLDPRNDDYVTLRRELCNFQFLGRERDGSRYWKMERRAEAGF